jgi:hypothetical protein
MSKAAYVVAFLLRNIRFLGVVAASSVTIPSRPSAPGGASVVAQGASSLQEAQQVRGSIAAALSGRNLAPERLV